MGQRMPLPQRIPVPQRADQLKLLREMVNIDMVSGDDDYAFNEDGKRKYFYYDIPDDWFLADVSYTEEFPEFHLVDSNKHVRAIVYGQWNQSNGKCYFETRVTCAPFECWKRPDLSQRIWACHGNEDCIMRRAGLRYAYTYEEWSGEYTTWRYPPYHPRLGYLV